MPQSGKSNAERAYDELRALILQGRLRAGQSLRASVLAEEYGHGLTPLREALNRLRTEQLVTASFNQGFQVAGMSEEDLEDLERTRGLLETEMLAEAIRDGDEAWEGGIVAAHYQLSKHPVPAHDSSDAEIDAWGARHMAFHDALLAACRSRWLGTMAGFIGAQRQRYHRNILRDVADLARADPAVARRVDTRLQEVMGLPRHTRLMEATLSRDTAASRAEMAEHVQLTLTAYRSFQELIHEKRAA